MRSSERGQVVPLAAVALVLAGVVALGLVRVANAAGGQAAAEAAADAAALAAVHGGAPAASRVAEANGAVVLDYVERGAVVTVRVRRGCCTARASATWSTEVDLPP
jgi:Flp pilus assembly protein TadG